MITQEDKDNGKKCRGQGFDCAYCSAKGACVDYVKPNISDKLEPLGLRPNAIWKDLRLQEIKQAMARFAAVDVEIPSDWVDEYLWLTGEIRRRKG